MNRCFRAILSKSCHDPTRLDRHKKERPEPWRAEPGEKTLKNRQIEKHQQDGKPYHDA
jgi:hypothetical protein